jgi:alkylated DNA repair protein alkB homolog 7
MRQGHFDGVIHHYREMHVSAWPEGLDGLSDVLGRLLQLCPTREVQTHVLHLASYGDILPHVGKELTGHASQPVLTILPTDNLEASGSFIMGVSLGDERILRMQPTQDESQPSIPAPFDLLLPSGSVYLQR